MPLDFDLQAFERSHIVHLAATALSSGLSRITTAVNPRRAGDPYSVVQGVAQLAPFIARKNRWLQSVHRSAPGPVGRGSPPEFPHPQPAPLGELTRRHHSKPRRHDIRQLALFGVLVVAAVAQTEHQSVPAADPVPLLPAAPTPAELATGRRLFQAHCAACHGPGGEGGKGPTLAQPLLPRASTDEALVRIIAGGISGTEMPRSRLEPAEIRLVAAQVRALGRLPVEKVPGDPRRGAQVFATQGGCAQCHSLNGHGGAIGPDLSSIGRQRSAAYLRRALTDPGAEVPQSFTAFRGETGIPDNFLFMRVVTRTGATVAGVRVNEDPFSLQLRDLAGGLHSFFKSELVEIHKDWGFTPMPSYATALTKDELDDLVAFLVSRQGQK